MLLVGAESSQLAAGRLVELARFACYLPGGLR